jgi:UDP-2,3-diacylglucosamine pyrophosphatase LpxH
MKIEDFIRDNKKIEIISNKGKPTPVPEEWRPVLSRCEILVVIPDMHMYLYNSNLDNFKYGSRAMVDFLNHVDNLKEEMALEDNTLRVYQIGDMFEQRFPGLGSGNATATEIRMSHPRYDQIINTMDGMRTHYLYGNHDFELRHFPSFRFAALEGKVYLEHGFAADKWTDFANPNAVFWEPSQLVFLGLREINEFFSRILVSAGVIGKDEHFAPGVGGGEDPDYTYPSEKVYRDEYGKKYFDHYSKRMEGIPGNTDAKICIIGHTHHAYLDPQFGDGKYIFIDSGAWTGSRSDFTVITNEEVGICCYNRE